MRFPSTLSVRQRRIATPMGAVLLARTDAGLAGLWFEGQRHSPDSANWTPDEGDTLLREAEHQMLDYFAGRRAAFDLPLDLSHGTPFQQAVWRALCAIERGQTTRYGQLAAQLGQPSASRAVGAAVGRNPISVIVPCHRVVGADGNLTGYAGGLPRKVQLLTLEGAVFARPRDEKGQEEVPRGIRAGASPRASPRASDNPRTPPFAKAAGTSA